MASKFKKSIYLTGKLINIYDECNVTKERDRSFSGRVSDIVERYTVLMALTEVPELTGGEKVILGEAVLGSFIDRNKIRYLPDSIRDTEMPGAEDLANKVEKLDYNQRLKLIEELKI